MVLAFLLGCDVLISLTLHWGTPRHVPRRSSGEWITEQAIPPTLAPSQVLP